MSEFQAPSDEQRFHNCLNSAVRPEWLWGSDGGPSLWVLGDPQGLWGKQQQDLIMVYEHEAKCCSQKTYCFRNSSGVKILFCIAERRCSSGCPKGTTSWSASEHRVLWGGTKGQWAEKWSGWTGYCAHKWTTERAGGMEISKPFLIVNVVIHSQKCDSLRQHKIVVYYLDQGLTLC